MNKAIPSVLAVVTARGGSKGVPGKNLRSLGGRPLIAWTIEAALAAECVTRVVVSTDTPDIAEAARSLGADVPFKRPAELATDAATSSDVIAHALSECPGYDVVLLLQPTSPLRTAFDIDSAFSQMQAAAAEGCVSVSEVEKSPWLMFRLGETGHLERLLLPWPGGMRRQDLPMAYVLNGAMYFTAVEAFKSTGQLVANTAIGYVLPVDRAIDIDTLDDFDRAERILATRTRGG